ncbi:O-antigen ligase family protein [Agrococcus sp. Marseille-Q4369]|uniref:O-antigen ligase family protein n=1 Tax=Agrococcus sp. Marseille-Q4369 TaxID=2810513 RepID=UPI001B8D0116|nr:O-antigen ligase family protein [Agrococcus sp. Marseille-Q4369]QUW18575.1 O-antigen ligase family protein [Agrococcus sp. Marseille-Q4369]
MPNQRRRALLATWVVVHAAAGDAVRNLIGYPAWGVLIVASIAWVVVELVLLRVRLSRLPNSIAMFTVLAVVSATWAISPGASLLGSIGLIGMVASAIFIAALPYRLILAVFHWSLQGLLLASLAFELFVSLALSGPLFPLWSDYPPGTTAEFSWSSGLLLQGGRIQGVMGNANLLAMLALVALVVAACRAIAGMDRLWPIWILLPIGMLVLARSATVTFALLAVAIIGGLIAAWVRWRGAAFYRIFAIVIAAGLVALGLIIANWAHVADFLNRDADLTGRFDIWGRVVDLALSSPVVGVGYLGYWQPWVPPFHVLGRVGDVAYLQAHNVWLDVFLQLGIVGVILWAAMQWRAMVNCLGAMYRSRPEEYAMNAAPLLLWVAFFVQGLAESRPWLEYGMILLLILTIGRRRREIVPRAPKTVAIGTIG